MTTALALAGCEWANLRTVTPVQHAEELAGPTLEASGWRRLAPGVDLLLMEKALQQHATAPGNNFARVGRSPSALAPAFVRTVNELRLAGVEARHLRQGIDDTDKASVIVAVYRAYESCIEEARCYDDARLYRQAIDQTNQSGTPTGGILYAIADGTPLAELAYRYVQAISGGQLTRIGHADYGISPAPHMAAARLQQQPQPQDTPPAPAALRSSSAKSTANKRRPGEEYIQGDLFAAAEPAPFESSNSVEFTPEQASMGSVHPACGLLGVRSQIAAPARTQLRQAHGSESEVRGVVREVLNRRLPLDSVEIAYTDASPYLSLLLDLVQRFDLPAHFAGGIPARLTNPGRALAAFYGWIHSDFAPAVLIHALRAGQLRLEASDNLHESRLAALLAQARVAKGSDSYRSALERLRGENGGSDQVTEAADPVDRAGAVIERLIAMIPHGHASSPDGNTTLASVARMSIDFLSTFAPVRGALDEAACDLLIQYLRQVAPTHFEGPLLNLIEWLGSRIAEYDCQVSAARPASLYIAPLSRAGYSTRVNLYVVGMDEYSFPGGAGSQDAILLDAERTAVSQVLPLQRHGAAARRWQLARAIGMCPGTVTLVSNRINLSDGREPYPSPLFQHLQQHLGGDAPATWRPLPERQAVALDEAEQVLARYRDRGYEQRVGERFPWMVDGARAARARRQHALTRFDGWLGAESRQELAINVDPESPVMSAAKLETLAKCPRQYFLRYILAARPPDEVETDTERWLQPVEMGQLLHELYRDFMAGLVARGARADAGSSQQNDELAALLDEKIAQFESRVPVCYQEAYRADVIRLRRSARVFLKAESEHAQLFPTTDPSAFEVEFGFGSDRGQDRSDPVSLELSDRVGFSLRGRIDRIDVVGSGANDEYEIWDYKTGSPYRFEGHDLLQGGVSLQWVLYAYALEKHTGKKVRRSGYFFAGDRGWGRRVEAALPERRLLASLLEPLFDMVAQGAFLPVQRDGDNHCRFCDFRRVCSSERKTQRDLSDLREETSQLRAIAGEWERLRHDTAVGTSRDTVQAYLADAGVESIDDVLVAEADSSLLHWMSGLQPELQWR